MFNNIPKAFIILFFSILFFSFVYYHLGKEHFRSDVSNYVEKYDYASFLYFSVTIQVFNSVGDIVPSSNISRFWICLQSLISFYILLTINIKR